MRSGAGGDVVRPARWRIFAFKAAGGFPLRS